MVQRSACVGCDCCVDSWAVSQQLDERVDLMRERWQKGVHGSKEETHAARHADQHFTRCPMQALGGNFTSADGAYCYGWNSSSINWTACLRSLHISNLNPFKAMRWAIEVRNVAVHSRIAAQRDSVAAQNVTTRQSTPYTLGACPNGQCYMSRRDTKALLPILSPSSIGDAHL